MELKPKIGIKNGNVIINFESPVHWIRMSHQDALQFAYFIRQQALEAGSNTDILRASGDVVCEECGDTYYHHPSDMKQLFEGRPFLRVACDGRRLKL